jgi:hypothetical protein
MTLPSARPSEQPISTATSIPNVLKFSKKQLALAAIAAISDSIVATSPRSIVLVNLAVNGYSPLSDVIKFWRSQ